jgi:hypothetical protein
MAQQLFGQVTSELLLSLRWLLNLPSSEIVTAPVADVLNKVLEDLGAFPALPPEQWFGMKWEYKFYSWQQTGGVFSTTDPGTIPEITEALNKLGNAGWEAVSAFPIAIDPGGTNRVCILLKRAVSSQP